MSTPITPTVGRIVHFYEYEEHGDAPLGPFAAIVTAVHSDRSVNICLFGHTGSRHSHSDVSLVQPSDAVPRSGHYCAWMPYQKQKAAEGRPDSESAEESA